MGIIDKSMGHGDRGYFKGIDNFASLPVSFLPSLHTPFYLLLSSSAAFDVSDELSSTDELHYL